MTIFLRFMVFFCTVSFASDPAFAQKFLDSYKKDMPEVEFIPEDEFNSMTFLDEGLPFDEPALEYSIRLPNDWTKIEMSNSSDFSVSEKVFSEAARYYGPPSVDARSNILVQVINLEYKLTAEQWMLWYLLKRGLAVQGFKVHDETRAEAIFVVVENDVQYAIRSLVILNGKYAILVEYAMPTDNWQDEKVTQAQVIDSFDIINTVKQDIEPMETYRFLDICGFKYPESWQLKAPPLKTIDRMNVDLLLPLPQESEKSLFYKRALSGKMEVFVVSIQTANSLNEEIDVLKERASEQGLVAGELIDYKDDFETHPQIKLKALDVYELQDTENNLIKYEFWLATMVSDEYYFFVTLMTPSRDQDYFAWARNTETMKIVLAQFQPVLETKRSQ